MSYDEAQDANRRATIENVLCLYPGVREAAVIHDARGGFVVFVVPDDSYLYSVLGAKSVETMVLGRWRKAVDLDQFTKDAKSSPVGFNIQGWNSTYTSKALPAEEMREWLQVTVTAILQFAPKKVYEIGCGTGLLLMQIAPRCDRYVAVDFSPAALAKLREQLQSVPSLAGRVEVIERKADNFEGLDSNSIDAVVINSVTHYFPNLAYLKQVLESAVNIVKPGGHVFVGDVLSLTLLPAFASSVELFQAADGLGAGELRARIRRRIQLEPWLFLSPALFLSLPRLLSKVSRVEIQPRLGRADNEVTHYRYNAIIHVGHKTEPAFEVAFEDWSEHELTLEEISSILRGRLDAIGIQRIRNSRLDKDLRLMEKLRTADETLTAGELRRELVQCETRGIHPQDLADLCTEDSGFRVLLSWAACRADGSYDAFFIPAHSPQHQFCSAVNWPQPELSDFAQFANSPGQGKFRAELVNQIMEHYRQNLPEELAYCDITLVDMIPRTADGSIDANALLRSRHKGF